MVQGGVGVSNQVVKYHLSLVARFGELLETLKYTAIVAIANNRGEPRLCGSCLWNIPSDWNIEDKRTDLETLKNPRPVSEADRTEI